MRDCFFILTKLVHTSFFHPQAVNLFSFDQSLLFLCCDHARFLLKNENTIKPSPIQKAAIG